MMDERREFGILQKKKKKRKTLESGTCGVAACGDLFSFIGLNNIGGLWVESMSIER